MECCWTPDGIRPTFEFINKCNTNADDEEVESMPDQDASEVDDLAGTELTCELTKKKGSWGFDADFWSDKIIQIVAIAEAGPLAESNSAASKSGDPTVDLFDVITAINGKPATWKSFKVIKGSKDKSLKLTVVRPYRFHVNVSKDGDRWGLDMTFHETRSSCLAIKGIMKGAVGSHNSREEGHRHIKTGDFILGVNDVSGQPLQMKKELQSCETANFALLRLLHLHGQSPDAVLTNGSAAALTNGDAPGAETARRHSSKVDPRILGLSSN